MKTYTLIVRLDDALRDAVAVEWTNAPAPVDSGQGWHPCLRRPDRSWRFSSHDPSGVKPPHLREPGDFSDLAIRYRLSAAGPWSAVSESRKDVLILEIDEKGEPVPVPPLLTAAPTLIGVAEIGSEMAVDPGPWGGFPAPQLAFQWRSDGAAIPGAVGRAYTLTPADDLCDIDCVVTATNAGGAVAAASATRRAVYPAPQLAGALPEEVFDAGTGPQAVETAFVFVGANLRFTATGAVVDPATGVLSISTGQPVEGEKVTVTAANSGGAVSAELLYTVEAVAQVAALAPTAAMIEESMIRNAKLIGFQDYAFVKYSQQSDPAIRPYQSSCIPNAKGVHLAEITALAAFAGIGTVHGGRTPADHMARMLTFWVAEGGAPAARGGVGMQRDQMFAVCAALGRNTPAVWNAITPANRERIARVMEGLLVSACWQNSDNNPWVRAGNSANERTIVGAQYGRGRVPNFTTASVLMPAMVSGFMGAAAAESFIATFDRAAFANAIQATGAHTGALTDLWDTFRQDWSGPRDGKVIIGPGPTAAELKAALRPLPNRSRYTQYGKNFTDFDDAAISQIVKVWGNTITPGGQVDAGDRQPPGVSNIPGEFGVFEAVTAAGVQNPGNGRGKPVGRLTPAGYAAWNTHIYRGQTGMATELSTRDGGGGGVGGLRASMAYAHEGPLIILPAICALAGMDVIRRNNPALTPELARQDRGVYDLKFRNRHGHEDFAKGGLLWGGGSTSRLWTQAHADDEQYPLLYAINDEMIVPWFRA